MVNGGFVEFSLPKEEKELSCWRVGKEEISSHVLTSSLSRMHSLQNKIFSFELKVALMYTAYKIISLYCIIFLKLKFFL